jgi:hypothetical protein
VTGLAEAAQGGFPGAGSVGKKISAYGMSYYGIPSFVQGPIAGDFRGARGRIAGGLHGRLLAMRVSA